eukprot:1269789-Pyramimonas_sp.AAC.1
MSNIESEMEYKVMELVKLKYTYESLLDQERAAPAKATAAWAQCASGGVGVQNGAGVAVLADDP